MLETSARLLRLLALLQSRRDWTGDELADRLDVTRRTVRNDIHRLRTLGYPVEARPGVGGGYRLGPGGSLPPLLLDDEETVAVAIGLRTAAGSVTGVEEASLRALSKLQQLLPAHLRHRVRAFEATVPVPARGPRVDPDVLTAVAGACRDHEVLRFDYVAHSGRTSRRRVEPHRLVHDRRWYLVAWDLEHAGWRTFRVDRLTPKAPTGPRFAPRPLPPDDQVAAHVARDVREATWRYRARVVVHAPADAVRARLPYPAVVEPLDDQRSAFDAGSDDPDALAAWIALLGADVEIADAPELRAALGRVADRLARAAGRGPGVRGPLG